MQDVLRLADALSRVYVLNNFQPSLILFIFCMRGFEPPSLDTLWQRDIPLMTAMRQNNQLINKLILISWKQVRSNSACRSLYRVVKFFYNW